MKKLPLIVLTSCIVMFLTPSCKKENKDQSITQVENVKIFKNQTYIFTVPPNESDDEFQITSQAKHYSTSELTMEGNADNLSYKYTPALNYVGSDQVIIANVEEDHHHMGGFKHGHGGGCSQGHDQETERTIIINFEIVDMNSKIVK